MSATALTLDGELLSSTEATKSWDDTARPTRRPAPFPQRWFDRLRQAERVLIAEEYEGLLPKQDRRLAELYGVLNDKYFEGVLPAIPVVRGIPPQHDPGGRIGAVTTFQSEPFLYDVSLRIYIAELLFSYSCGDEANRWVEIADKTLHEMVHVAVHLDSLELGDDCVDLHGPRFTAECNRLGLILGGPLVHPGEFADGRSTPEDPPPESYFCCDGWPNRHLPGGYGPVLSRSVIEEFANPWAQQ